MKHKLHKASLRKKGWTQTEIDHAEAILRKAFENNPIKGTDQFIFWCLLLLSITGIAIFAFEIIPLLLLIKPLSLIIILLIISFSFGSLLTIVIEDIHWLSNKHHGFAISTLLIATITIFLIIIHLSTKYGTPKTNGWIAGTIFGLGLITPYLVHFFTSHQHRKN